MEHEIGESVNPDAAGWPSERRASWVDAYCRRAFDGGQPLPLPERLARDLILPELARGVREGRPGCARWMAQVPHALESHRDSAGLPATAGLREALLERALAHDPLDDRARRLLEAHLRAELEWACGGETRRADPGWVASRALRVAAIRAELGLSSNEDVARWLRTAAGWASRPRGG